MTIANINFFVLINSIIFSLHGFALETQSLARPFQTFDLISFSLSNKHEKELELQEAFQPTHEQEETARKLLELACENYLVILPKELGCTVCQLSHRWMNSEKYRHVEKRCRQTKELIQLLNKKPFSAHDIVDYLKNRMGPFERNYGKQFHAQCMTILQPLYPFCKDEDKFISDIP